jgi:hypothetical protein
VADEFEGIQAGVGGELSRRRGRCVERKENR